MEEIIKKRIIIKDKLEYLAHASNTANHRKLKSRLSRELTLLDERSRNILAMKLANGALTIEKFDVADATRYKNQKGIIKYPTWYSPIENQPAAFIGSENILKKFKIYPQEMSENEIREKLCEEQESNDLIMKQEEEEEEYEEFVIPKIKKN